MITFIFKPLYLSIQFFFEKSLPAVAYSYGGLRKMSGLVCRLCFKMWAKCLSPFTLTCPSKLERAKSGSAERSEVYRRVALFLILLPSFICAQNEGELFLQANQLYAQNDYVKAHDMYEKINNKGHAVWYNMGVCNYQLKNWANARLCWERARNGASQRGLRDIQRNQQLLDQQLNSDEQSGSFKVVNTLSIFIESSSLLFLQLLLLILLYCFFFLSRRRMVGFFYVFCLGIAVCTASLFVIKKYSVLNKIPAVVMQSKVSMYAGPDVRYHVIDNLVLARVVYVKQQLDDWYKVSSGEKTGWVLADMLTVV